MMSGTNQMVRTWQLSTLEKGKTTQNKSQEIYTKSNPLTNNQTMMGVARHAESKSGLYFEITLLSYGEDQEFFSCCTSSLLSTKPISILYGNYTSHHREFAMIYL